MQREEVHNAGAGEEGDAAAAGQVMEPLLSRWAPQNLLIYIYIYIMYMYVLNIGIISLNVRNHMSDI